MIRLISSDRKIIGLMGILLCVFLIQCFSCEGQTDLKKDNTTILAHIRDSTFFIFELNDYIELTSEEEKEIFLRNNQFLDSTNSDTVKMNDVFNHLHLLKLMKHHQLTIAELKDQRFQVIDYYKKTVSSNWCKKSVLIYRLDGNGIIIGYCLKRRKGKRNGFDVGD